MGSLKNPSGRLHPSRIRTSVGARRQDLVKLPGAPNVTAKAENQWSCSRDKSAPDAPRCPSLPAILAHRIGSLKCSDQECRRGPGEGGQEDMEGGSHLRLLQCRVASSRLAPQAPPPRHTLTLRAAPLHLREPDSERLPNLILPQRSHCPGLPSLHLLPPQWRSQREKQPRALALPPLRTASTAGTHHHALHWAMAPAPWPEPSNCQATWLRR